MNDKSLAKNSIFSIIYKLLNVLFPLITMTYVSRVLLADGVGKVSAAQNIVTYFTWIAALGLPFYGTREIAKHRALGDKNKVFTELFFINFLSTSFCVLLYYFLINNFQIFNDNSMLRNVAGLTIVFNYINVDWFYQGYEEYKYIAIRSFFIKLISLLLIFVFVKNENDYSIYAFIYTLGIAGNNIMNIINLRKYNVKFIFHNLNLSIHMKSLVILLSTNIAIEIYTLLDTTMLSFLCDDYVVGYYTNSIKLVKVVTSIITAIGTVLLPRFSYLYQNKKYKEINVITNFVFKVMLLISIASGVGIFLLSPYVIPVFFGDSFIPAIRTTEILSIMIFVQAFSSLFGTQILIMAGEEKKMLYSTIVPAIFNVILNFILIPRINADGAAYASIISEIICTLMTYYFAKKYVQIEISKNFILSVFISIISMIISIQIIIMLVSSKILVILLSISVGGLIYIGVLYLFKNETLIYIIKIARKDIIKN